MSVYSFDPRRSREIRATNLAGARNALGVAVELGLDPVVHVSSFGALLPTGGRVLTEDSPVGHPYGAYARSKADQEGYARSLQEAGAPVVITYPGAIWGPHDPHDGESVVTARRLLRGLTPFLPRRGVPLVDARAAYAIGRVLAIPQRVLPFRLPVDPGTPWVVACDARMNSGRVESELGIHFRPTRDTIADQVSWMTAAGRL